MRLMLLLIFAFIHTLSAQNFRSNQQKNVRVQVAYKEKWENLKNDLVKKGVDKNNFEMFIRVFKTEKIIEVWLKSKVEKEFKKFKTYAICASSGTLGPKRKQGDGQVPEGFYNVSVFNPYSNYYLSLGVSYPNASDRVIGKNNLGGDIMIHGNCLTIGCIPLTDPIIKEVYILAVEARNNGQSTIPIHIFPAKLDTKAMEFLISEYKQNNVLIDFWKNLKECYDYFELHIY
nr:L,D-transpeptidase family protein [Bacteroidota bacterium]